MMFTADRQWVLVGLVSNGYGCARAGYSTIYTRIAAYESWIRSTTNGSYMPVSISVDVNRSEMLLLSHPLMIMWTIWFIQYFT